MGYNSTDMNNISINDIHVPRSKSQIREGMILMLDLNNGNIPEETEYVWYACYGSNMNYSRFMDYVDRCADKTPPVADGTFNFQQNIYFAKSASGWDDGGKAFLDDTCPGFAFGRIYKITRNQFMDIKCLEGRDYRRRLDLGTVAGLPVYSFTDQQKNYPERMPSVRYFNTILDGLAECYEGIEEKRALAKYLIKRILPGNTFQVVRAIRENDHYLSNIEISSRTEQSLSDVTAVVAWLVEHQVIQQDRRSVEAGHRLDDPQAYFFTTKGSCARELIDAMIKAMA